MNLFRKKATLYILLASTIIMIVLMFLQGMPLNVAGTAGILSLELAPSQMAVDSVLDSWAEASSEGNNIINTAIHNTLLDFIFLTCYSLFLFTCALQLAAFFSAKKMFTLLAVAALLAGMLDIIENVGMLQSLQGKGTDTIAATTAIAAYFKWIIVIAVVLVVLVSFILLLARRKNKPA